ncbi:MAG: hypothetical protein RL033_4239 [Pseudomonadota bacterium]
MERPPPPEQEVPSCPLIGCQPESFDVLFERSSSWSPGTYYIRASVDGRAQRVCSVVFEPVLGAAHDTCGGEDVPFRVHYRYDELEQTISGVSFGQVHSVQLSVLTSEDVPPLAQADHQLTFQYSTSDAACGVCPSGPEPLTVRVSEPWEGADAGGDAAPGSQDGGATPIDAGSDAVDAGRDAAL